MTIVTVIYPRKAGTSFDFAYYEREHLPMVRARWSVDGLQRLDALRGVADAQGGDAPFHALALLTFASMDAVEAAMTGAHGKEVMADIPNFTNAEPVIQVNEPIDG